MQIYIHCLELFDEGEEKVKFREKIKAHLEHAENMKERLRPVIEELPHHNHLIRWNGMIGLRYIFT